MSTCLSLQPLLLSQNRLQIFQVSILIILTNKRVNCCFFPPGRVQVEYNHVHRSIFTATTLVPEQTTNSPSSRPSPNAGAKLPTQQNVIKNDVPEETMGGNKLLFLLFLPVFDLILMMGIVVFCCKRRKIRKPEKKDARKVEQTCPLTSRRSRKLLI